MLGRRILGTLTVAVKAALVALLLAPAQADPPARLLLLGQPAAVAGWSVAPDLTRQAFQPALLDQAGSRTAVEAATRVRQAVVDSRVSWVRLDTLDLTNVGFCEACQPPPVDPHRVTEDQPPARLSDQQYAFFAACAEALRGTGAQPCVIVPAGLEPPPGLALPADLWVLLAAPPATSAAAVSASRQALWERWHAVAPACWSLVTDGLGDFLGLPLNGDWLRAEAAHLSRPAVVARDAASFASTGPPWLTAALANHHRRAARYQHLDQPLEAAALDLFRPHLADLDDRLPDHRLARLTVQSLAAVEAWAQQRGRSGDLRSTRTVAHLLAARRQARGRAERSGTFSAAFAAWLPAAGPLPSLALGRVGEIACDGLLDAAEWRGSTTVSLTGDEYGRRNPRPATVHLGWRGDRLYLGVTATEPDPAQATLHDGVSLTFDGPELMQGFTGGLARFELTVGGEVRGWRRPLRLAAEPLPTNQLRDVIVAGTFDGPGFVLEASLPVPALAAGEPVRLRLATFHRRGAERHETVWPATGGQSWDPLRFADLRRRG